MFKDISFLEISHDDLYISFPLARLVQSEEEQQPLATTIEEVVTFYCKSRNMSYNEESGWTELLAPLVALGFSKADLFNCLYMLLAKYIPRYKEY